MGACVREKQMILFLDHVREGGGGGGGDRQCHMRTLFRTMKLNLTIERRLALNRFPRLLETEKAYYFVY